MAQAALTVQGIFDYVKARMAEESSDTGNLTIALCIQAINAFSRFLETEVDMPIFEDEQIITLLNNQSEYSLPADYSRSKGVSTTVSSTDLSPIPFDSFASRHRFRLLAGGGYAYHIDVKNDNIILYINGVPSTSGGAPTVTHDYTMAVDDMVLATDTLPGHKRYHYMYAEYTYKIFAQVEGEDDDFVIQDLLTKDMLESRKIDEPRKVVKPRRAFSHYRRPNINR